MLVGHEVELCLHGDEFADGVDEVVDFVGGDSDAGDFALLGFGVLLVGSGGCVLRLLRFGFWFGLLFEGCEVVGF